MDASYETSLFYYLLALADGQDAAADAIVGLLAYGELATPEPLIGPRERNSGPAFVGSRTAEVSGGVALSFQSAAQQLVPPPRRHSAVRTPEACAPSATDRDSILPSFAHATLASLQTGASALLDGDDSEALRLWKQAGEGGEVGLQYLIGMLLISQPNRQAKAEGQKWLQVAADNGLADLGCLTGAQGD